jgi:hypothetical protein
MGRGIIATVQERYNVNTQHMIEYNTSIILPLLHLSHKRQNAACDAGNTRNEFSSVAEMFVELRKEFLLLERIHSKKELSL